jgi:hypothetical protein
MAADPERIRLAIEIASAVPAATAIEEGRVNR